MLKIKDYKNKLLYNHLARYYMYRHLKKIFEKIKKNKEGGRILSISKSLPLCDLIAAENYEIIECNFPEYNVLNLPFSNNYFDFVVSDQVLEHIEGEPQRVVDESFRILKQGGLAVYTTCFLFQIHPRPKDFWRFTPEALTLLFRKFSKIIDSGGWGNKIALIMCSFGLWFCLIPNQKWHPLHKIATHNNKLFPIMTWIVAQK